MISEIPLSDPGGDWSYDVAAIDLKAGAHAATADAISPRCAAGASPP